MRNYRYVIVALTLAITAAFTSNASAQIDARIERIGLFAGPDPIVRSEQWCLAQVAIRYRGAEPFDVELRLDQRDRDGDVVTSITPFPLTPNAEWESHDIYFVPHEINRNAQVRIRLFDDEGNILHVFDEKGQEVTELLSPTYREWPPRNEFLILDLSTPHRLSHAYWLDSERRGVPGELNARTVRAMPPSSLPSRWEGLEAVDAIVWNDADPSSLSNDQMNALAGWIKAGGKMLISAGSNWQRLAGSNLGALLPVRITGVRSTSDLDAFLAIVRNEDYRAYLAQCYQNKPIQVCETSLRKLAIPIPGQCEGTPLAYRHQIGRGSLTFVAASIPDLLPVPHTMQAGNPNNTMLDRTVSEMADFSDISCEQVIGRTFLGLAPGYEQEHFGIMARDPTDLFQRVRDTIAFGSLSATFVVFAIIFAIVYTIVAAGASYWYLKRRGWLHHCWTAFALVSIAGSVIGTCMVWTLRGFRMKLWQTTVVDARACEADGVAMCMFGVKTPKHTRLDLRLPINEREDDEEPQQCGPIRSMPDVVDPFAAQSVFVAPERYESVFRPNTMTLKDVKVRATLKEFQGMWQGPLGGMIDAKLYRGGEDNDFTEQSYISNRLNVTLRDCYLITTRDDYASRPSVIRCFRLGDMPTTGSDSTLAGEALTRRLYINPRTNKKFITVDQMLPSHLTNWRQRVRTFTTAPAAANNAETGIASLSDYSALLLASFYGMMGPNPNDKTVGIVRGHARPLECSHMLTQDTALLIGYTIDHKPPAILQVDDEDLEPEQSLTMYRFTIPIERAN